MLVNNAGVLHAATIEGTSEEQWDRLMTVNLKGPFLMCKAALLEFRKAGGGAIVNVGSVLGLGGDEGSRGVLRVKGRSDHADEGDGAGSRA